MLSKPRHPDCNGNPQKLCVNDCQYCYLRSFASCPRSIYWSNKNNVKPRQVFLNSSRKFLFNCTDCKHEIEMTISTVTNGGWCKYCNKGKLCNDTNCLWCLYKSFRSHYKSIYWSNKNVLKPRQVSKNSHESFLFNCGECKHEIEMKIYSIFGDRWCRYCNREELCDDNNCIICFDKSFASSDKAKFWSDKNQLKPRQVRKNSHNTYIFNCEKCNHDIDMSLDGITRGRWCKYCNSGELCDNMNCLLCLYKSFRSHYKSIFWSDKNELKPRQITKRSSTILGIFNCKECEHEFEMRISDATDGKWCPYCSSKRLCIDNCETCYYKSFASHERAIYWSDKNYSEIIDFLELNKIFNELSIDQEGRYKLKQLFIKTLASAYNNYDDLLSSPRHVFLNSGKKYWFTCEVCKNDFNKLISSISANESWCPICKHKTEKKIINYLKTLNDNVFHNIILKKYQEIDTYRFDFMIDNIIIECDGDQHFIQLKKPKHYKRTNEEQLEIDIIKMKAVINDYVFIRLRQEDVLMDKYDWKKFIDTVIDKGTKGTVYISSYKNELYENHIKDFKYEIIG